MKFLKTARTLAIVSLSMFFACNLSAQQIQYDNNWNEQGMQLTSSGQKGVEVGYSIESFSFYELTVDREEMKAISLPGHFLFNDKGMPDLPGKGRYIAIPQGATARLKITDYRTELIENISIAPAPEIPKGTDNQQLKYEKNQEAYSTNAFYPENPVALSEPSKIRGMDVVMLGVTPFQYNPVTKELLVYRDLEIEIEFEGGNGTFGEERLRSRWFDPILQDAVFNVNSIPQVDYAKKFSNVNRDDVGCEYLIISPNDDVFQQWADSIKQFRIKQGILTDVVTLEDIGGNNSNLIEQYLNDAYNNWDIPPAAVLLLGDYGSSAADRIMSPVWNGYCVSDNIYADVDNDDLPDIVLARITAQNESQLEVMVTKFLNYERTPPTNPDFYDNPITALGWQTERWFQICSETVGGFFKNELGKNPVRINEIYDGNPAVDPWSTASNTNTIMNYFGPNGLDYLPASPSELGNWSGGNATDINNAINNGSFLLQHRDHGGVTGWGEPAYNNNSINGLTNTDLTFIMSINCLTGKYNTSGECFTEKFHRYTYNGQNSGALGLIAASEISYSFVNDTYVWGLYDNMWPDFMPDYGTNPESRGLLPAFGNAAGKYFLQQSNWPGYSSVKVVTYHLFHHHGDAFMTLYSEVPQDLTVIHNPVIIGGSTTFSATADEGSFIALTNNGEILATADGTGAPVEMNIPVQTPGDTVIVTVTKTNYYRYEANVPVISPEGPYCVYNSDDAFDENNNGKLEYAENVYLSLYIENLGNDDTDNVEVTITTEDEYVNISDNTEYYGTILSQEIVSVDSGFMIEVSSEIPNDHNVAFDVICTNGEETWESKFGHTFYAPVLELISYEIIDTASNNNGRIDPGETVDLNITITNTGGALATNVTGDLFTTDEYLEILMNNLSYGNIDSEDTLANAYSLFASASTPIGHDAMIEFELNADYDLSLAEEFEFLIGQFPVVVVDLDPNLKSGPAMVQAIEDLNLVYEYVTELPDNDFALYGSMFVTLGNYDEHHALTEEEATTLNNYLNKGGNLYLEGRRTWFADVQYPVHSKFNIVTEMESWFPYDTMYGEEGTCTEGMMYEFDPEFSDFNYNTYYMEGSKGAFVLMRSEEESYGSTVANDAGGYKTIGSAFEFGALTDAAMPSTKANLMREYLDFFGTTNVYVGTEAEQLSKTEMTAYPNPFSHSITFEFNLEQNKKVELSIYDLQGRMIRTIADEYLNAGTHKFTWDGTNDPGVKVDPGLYFYIFKTENEVTSKKISLIY
ncbi:MAG: T9SS type A sorting domain-containing protein [Bacteroidales bacterium]|nr:T9SS type A sorting domain-containing protein [Bacteroidales bacterium]MCF8350335.1 T9SS type A sorting domain-containing protein [Bacteroidales bacterium]MCF8377645.1 T9SS type A sorting domain-containing protein [Bacteroidales bacterium]